MKLPLLAVLALGACTVPPPPPKVSSVAPARVGRTLPTDLSVLGEHFDYAVSADFDRPAQSTFTLGLSVRLLGPTMVVLPAAERVSPTEVSARVPPMLPVGRYAVEVTTARGTSQLADALEVTDCHLSCENTVVDGGCFSWPDDDRDGYGQVGSGAATCADDAGTRVTRGGDCADSDALRHPDAIELCNGLDDDCDGAADDGTCASDAGWTKRTDTGGNDSDWDTAANDGRGRVWLAEKQLVFYRPGTGGFQSVGSGCPNKLTASWAAPGSSLAWFGGDEVVTTHGVMASGCSNSQSLSDTVAGLQGFGTRIYGALRDGTLIEGQAGQVVEKAGFGAGVTVRDVQGFSPASLFAVGSAGAAPRVWRMKTDGGAFAVETVPSIPAQGLTGVWAVDDGLAYAVGTQGALLERSGGTWRALPPADGGLTAVRAFGLGRVYAVTGDGRVLRYDGVAWRTLYAGPRGFTDLTGSAEDDLWAVGHDGLVVHWGE